MPVPTAIPAPIQAALPADAEERLGAQLATDKDVCEGAKHHSPRPLLLHLVTLADGRITLLCGTCRDAAQVIELVHTADTSWEVMRAFGGRIRLLVTGSR
jgi:hypothetical protein